VTRRDAGRPRGDAIVDAVLDAAMAELADAGPEGVSVDRVARRAEVNKTTVYRRWPSRDDLVDAALRRAAAAIGDLPDRGSLAADLLAVAEAVAALLARPEGRALAAAAITGTRPPGRALERALPPVIARARDRGEWPDGADPGPVTSLLVGAVWHRVLVEQAPVDTAWLSGVVALLVAGVGAQPC
jgi:AcrR family transcriptional regulator